MTAFLRDLAARIVDEHGQADLPRSTLRAVLQEALDAGEITYDKLYDELRFTTTRGSTLDSVVVDLPGRGRLVAMHAMKVCQREDHTYIFAIALTALSYYRILEMGKRLNEVNLFGPATEAPARRKHPIARLLRWPWR